MPYEIVMYPAAVLVRPARRIGRKDGLDLHELCASMLEAMHLSHGVGLAAPQVGLSLRFIVAHNIAAQEDRGFANPQIVRLSRETDCRSEGCLSFPELYGDVERAKTVTVRYQDLDWHTHQETFEGHFARVLQHEIDHLNGVLLIDRAEDGLYRWEEVEETQDGEEQADSGNGAVEDAQAVASTPPEAS
jgi:peptide deformylase